MIKSIYSNTKIHFFNILKTHIFKTLILFYNVFLLHENIQFLALLWKYDKFRSQEAWFSTNMCFRLVNCYTGSDHAQLDPCMFYFMSFSILFFCCREMGKSKSIEIFDGYTWTLLEQNLSFGRAGHCPVRIRNYDFTKILR